MQLITRALPGLAAMLLFAVPAAHAQSAVPAMEQFFVNVNFGYQLAERTLTAHAEKSVYEETATLQSSLEITRGPMFDVAGGYRVWGDVFVGVGISRFGDTGTATHRASIPDPVFFNRPKTVTGTTDGLSRSELAINPHALWVTPLADKFDVSAGLGLSIIRLSQDLIGDFQIAPGTQNVSINQATTETATGVGFYAQVDFIYNIKPMYGVGGFVRYAGAEVDLPSSPDQDVGGMIAGGGIRLRF